MHPVARSFARLRPSFGFGNLSSRSWLRASLAPTLVLGLVAASPREDSPPEPVKVALSPKADSVAGESAASPVDASIPVGAENESIARAHRMIALCADRFRSVKDYTCLFHKRERIDSKLSPVHTMTMKVRTHPQSVYFKFYRPNAGREAIFVTGRHNGKVLAHDVGLGKLLAGTMALDPLGTMAMEGCRHPITEAGIGPLIETVRTRWKAELRTGESQVSHHMRISVGDRPCHMIESTHPEKRPEFLFHKVKLYVDRELGLPIRFEAYNWPATVGAEPELVEEYTYQNLKLNVGLTERDFDPKNSRYAFGRF